MPEAPDLQVIMEYLQPRIIGRRIVSATERKPLVIRNLADSANSQKMSLAEKSPV